MEFVNYMPVYQEELLELLRLNTPVYFAPEEKNDFIHYLEYYSENLYLLKENSVIIGCGGINIKDDPNLAYLSWDIIHPDFHKKGYGSELLAFRINQIKTWKNIHTIKVRTSQLTYPFYQKHGFTLTHQKKDFWAPGFDLYEMALKC